MGRMGLRWNCGCLYEMSASISEGLVLCVRSEQREATDAETDMVAWREMKQHFCCAPYTFYYYMIIELYNLLIPGLCSPSLVC